MGLLISLFFILLTGLFYLALAIFAFPEIAIFLLIFYHGLFDPKQHEVFFFRPFESFYPIYVEVYERLGSVEIHWKWIVYIGVPLIYLLLNSAIHIKNFYPLKFMGIGLSIWSIYTFSNSELQTTRFWIIVATIIGSMLAIGARLTVHRYVDSLLYAVHRFFIKIKSDKNDKRSRQSNFSGNNEYYEPPHYKENDLNDYYRFVLGVSETASKEEIKRAYRLLVMKYHPDKNPDGSSEEKYREVVEAYDNLMA
ncbi:DnaJ domain-containing protein [Enterococcus sp. AZ012]|uniref:DnaJ domain-containing protein n=1 Tax=unclassified Enterococcus TaxID=2608891 RepID=UPI003D2C1887